MYYRVITPHSSSIRETAPAADQLAVELSQGEDGIKSATVVELAGEPKQPAYEDE
jgi:hypothetical protein